MTRRLVLAVVLVALLDAIVGAHVAAAETRPPATPGNPIVLAHYYIWFDATSWNRAKSDLPAAGRYSSDEESVMRNHVEAARAVGIDGFIVSWKSTETLDPRLDQLVAIADELDFGLAVTYQGLDFNRDPLPPGQVAADLDVFIERWADRPAFDLFDRPLVAWTGTDRHDVAALAAVTSPRRDRLAILATEKNLGGYERVAEAVDGNLYYWASLDPRTFPGYPSKLIEMGDAVRANEGIWIAPAAPGFDARLLGGESVVGRRGGETLRDQWNGALASVPHAVGLISWNEFSENTHIEPSLNHGNAALRTVASLTGATIPAPVSFDSSEPGGVSRSTAPLRIGLLASVVGLVAVSGVVVARRQPGGDEP